MEIPPIPKERIQQLLKTASIEGCSREDSLKYLAELIDLGTRTLDSSAVAHAVELAKPLLSAQLPRTYKAQIYYFLSNAWATLDAINNKNPDDFWSWNRRELDQQILHLRLARSDADFKSAGPVLRSQVLTNLGNALTAIGRSVEAIELYDEALKVRPNFGMALGNKGRTVCDYAAAHYDRGQQAVMLCHSYLHLSECLNAPMDPHARPLFKQRLEWLSPKLKAPLENVERSRRPHKMGRSSAEIRYRKWVLSRRLFINPLNDLGPLEIASHDSLSLPNLTTSVSTGPKYHGLFNQLKQEFISARYFLYESSTAQKPHYSDRNTSLVDTLDYAAYGLGVEKAKISLRMSYSILDKIAFFLNDYLELGLPQKRVDFTSIWHLKGAQEKGLAPYFAAHKNWPLRGLYWLSRDGFEALEPSAREVRDLRHALEHRYVKVHLEGVPTRAPGDLFFDELAHSITRGLLEDMAIRALKSSRAALIYLSLGVNSHEQAKKKTEAPGRSLPISLPKYDDRFKQ